MANGLMYRRRVLALTLCVTGSCASAAFGQVKTDAPEPIAGAKPAVVERIKVKGAGFAGNLEGNAAARQVPQTFEGAFAHGAREMIVVLPDSKTVHNGSMYSASVTTGDFQAFIARDVVAYLDAHYRTIPRRESRGLVGHSMGGYGAGRIGMKHSDVFGSLHIMSPCCMSARNAGPIDAATEEALVSIKTPEDSAKAAGSPPSTAQLRLMSAIRTA